MTLQLTPKELKKEIQKNQDIISTKKENIINLLIEGSFYSKQIIKKNLKDRVDFMNELIQLCFIIKDYNKDILKECLFESGFNNEDVDFFEKCFDIEENMTNQFIQAFANSAFLKESFLDNPISKKIINFKSLNRVKKHINNSLCLTTNDLKTIPIKIR